MLPRRIVAAVVAVMAGAAVYPVLAATLDELQGAWTMEGTECDQTFRKTGNSVEFVDKGGSVTTGIIIAGNKISGPNATCTAQRTRNDGDRMTALLSCSDTILFDTIPVSFRVIDEDHFERFDPNFPDFAFGYQRCRF